MTEPNLTDHQIIDLTAQPTIAIRIEKPMADLDMHAIFDTQLPRVFQAVGMAGRQPVGAPYARYFQFGPDRADFEIGVPVSEPADLPPARANTDEVGTSELPAGRTAKLIHHGAYDTLGKSYDALHEWIHSQGVDEGDGPWESYIDDPGQVEMSNVRTEIYWPVSGN
ncbi:MAG TPA: GyrI-like domain-containing protein [Acidimicrobiia bacterium]